MWCWRFHTTAHQTYISMYTHHATSLWRCSVSPARARRRTSSRSRTSTLPALTPHDSYRKVPSKPKQTVDETIDILRQVNDVTAVPSLSPFQAIDTHDGTAFDDEHLLRLSGAFELVGHKSRVHVVGRRERLNRFFVALAAIARVLPFSHRRSLSICLGGKLPFPAELATPGSQPLKLVSEALLHVTMHQRLKIQSFGRIEGAQIAVFIPSIFLCC